ncbi:hypothetical protein NCAS_0C03010 [Naumovozyma castellii]|uniref:CNNM transmembrane domain-containing protein n=1 Tax=Naumovozyma castellii TaxID=27288 RepID=G0VCT1_NAUCA|nr:hypothetical protein NCAS_0C03010 [Naumovozyma castellii CBS 4309]CCC69291.1 hypothetical protein NCAS_0C03010 [Naumovozyma castellii CBS 4309]
MLPVRNPSLQRSTHLLITYFLCLIPRIHSLPLSRKASAPASDVASIAEGNPNITTYAIVSMILVLLGGVFAGLTLALMGQDEVYLKVMSSSGSPQEKKSARRVLSLISRGKHWVLVTLLLSNVITNESLPIVLDRCLGGGWQAVVSSTCLIVIFGEIIPQSICVKYGLQVGAFFGPFVLVLMYLMYPVAYPIALLLDYLLGEDHGTMYRKSGLKTLVTLHRTMGVDPVERLTQDEVTIISAVLDLKEKRVEEIMTPIENVFTMSADTILDDKTVELIFNSGFSRIPICLPNEPTNFIGMLLVRVLISYDPDDCLPISHFPLATLPETGPTTSCLNILNYFQEGKSHMCIVSKEPGSSQGAIGILTLEDVIEELIGEEIVDESDVFVDIHQHIMREQPGPLSKRHVTSYLHHLYTDSHKKHQEMLNQQEQERDRNRNRRSPPSDSTDKSKEKKRSESQPLLLSPTKQGDYSTISKESNSHVNLTTRSSPPLPSQNEYRSGRVYSTPGPVEFQTQKLLPSNLASHPLDIKKPFVIIKKPNESLTRTDITRPQEDSDGYLREPFTKEEDKLIEQHAKLAEQALEYTRKSGEPTQVTTSNALSPTSSSPLNDAGYLASRRSSDTNRAAQDKNLMISSSYKSTNNGIVESIITVKGVPKTIIEPAHDWEHSSNNVTSNSTDENSDDSRKSSLATTATTQRSTLGVSPK